jgi:hypothetical protein
MYKGILHTHTLSVLLFILLYLIKTFLLVTDRKEGLNRITALTKWPERIISILFLATGINLYVYSGNITWMVHLKIGIVLASIPIAIVGFKKKNKFLAVLSIVLLLGAYGLAEMNKKQISRKLKPEIDPTVGQVETGKVLYSAYCSPCHGENGDAGYSGAKNLRTSILSAAEKENLIRNGKANMPGFPNLSPDEIKSLIFYTDTFLDN